MKSSLYKFIIKHKVLSILGAILLLGFFLRLYHINYFDLWRDEAFSVNAANNSLLNIIEITLNDTHPPLHLLILHYWMKIFGNSEFSVRFPSLIFGIFTILATYKLSSLISKRKMVALISTLFVALNPLLIIYSQEARPYSMLTFFSIMAIFFLFRILKNPKWVDYVGFILFSVLGLYTHNIYIFVLMTLILFFGFRLLYKRMLKPLETKDKNSLIHFLVSIGIIFFLYLPGLFIFIHQYINIESNELWLQYPNIKIIIENINWVFTSHSYYSHFSDFDYLFVFLIKNLGISFLVFGMLIEIKGSKNRLPTFSLFLLGILSTIIIISFWMPFFFVRYLIFLTPIILIISALGAYSTIKLLGKIGTLFLILIFSLSSIGFFVLNIANNPDQKAHYRDAISVMKYNPETDIILHPHALTFHSFNYYSDWEDYIYDPEKKLANFEGLAIVQEADYFSNELNDYQRIWTICLTIEKDIEKILKQHNFKKTSSRTFHGNLHVQLWEIQNPPD